MISAGLRKIVTLSVDVTRKVNTPYWQADLLVHPVKTIVSAPTDCLRNRLRAVSRFYLIAEYEGPATAAIPGY